jgi:hypothetical protein
MLIDVIQKSMKGGTPDSYKTVFDAGSEPGPSDYIIKITKSMNSLNKVIKNMLSEESRRMIFIGVFPIFIDEIDDFISNIDEQGFEWLKNDLKHLENETKTLVTDISTGVAFIGKIRELQQASIEDLVYEEEEEDEEENE